MGYVELSESIRKQADAEIAEINEKSRQEVEALLRGWDEEAAEAAKTILAKAEEESELIVRQTVSKAKVDAKGLEARKKAQIMDAVFAKAKDGLLNSSKETRTKAINRLVQDGANVGDEVIIHVDKKHAPLLDRKNLKTLFKAFEIKEDKMDFGVIVESRDTAVRVDNQVDNIIDSLKKDLRSEVNKILFG